MRHLHRLLFAAALFSSPWVQAQQWPQKTIRLIVPFSAGGPSDVLARGLARSLGDALGQPMVVENRTGAGGSIGIDAVAKSPPDGYTIGFAHTGTTAINPHLFAKHPFDPLTDLTPITPIVSYANVLVVNPKLPVKSVSEFVAWAKANPAQATYASGGNGATNHLSGELLKSIAGAPLAHIPYKGNAPALVDVMAGNVSSMFEIPVTLIPHIKAGKVRPLGITSAKRSPYLPDVPTMREAGYPGFEEAGSDLWFGLVGPANMPPALLDKIYSETIRALKTPDLQETIKGMAYDIWTMPPAEFKTFIRNDYAKWGRVVKLSGAKAE